MTQPDNSNRRGARPGAAAVVVLFAAAIFARGLPNLAEYAMRLRETHRSSAIVGGALALLVVLAILFLGIWKSPRATACVLGLGALLLIIISGNAGAFLVAAGILGLTLLAGDGISRRLRGGKTEDGEISTSIGAGLVTLGIFLLLFGEAGLARPFPLTVAAAFFALTCARQISPLGRRVQAQAAEIAARRFSAIEALWLSVAVAGIGSSFLGALRPDVFFDSVAYHLPEIRDFATRGRVVPIPNIVQTALWHSYETFLGGAFLAGGERAVRLLHFFIGLAALASAVALAQRLRTKASAPLVLLAIAAVPAICAQLKETLVDLPAALLLTAAASELVPREEGSRRFRLGGFLFGGAITTKIFSLLGSVAFLVLLLRRPRERARAVLAFALFAAIPLLPWLAWSQARFGFFLSPYSDPLLRASTAPMGSPDAAPRPWSRIAPTGAAAFFRLPYDRTFQSVWFGRGGDGVLGLVPLLLLLGVLGWDRRSILLFSAAALAAVVPWYWLSAAKIISPSIRFLIPLYPLYAVFGALGLAGATENFRGRVGKAAAIGVFLLAIGFPAQFFGARLDAKMALGRVSTEQGLSAYLPAYRLWKDVRKDDRVLLLGEWDRYHCPAEFAIRDIELPPARENARAWWAEIRRLRITKILYRSDTRHLRSMLDALGDCIELVGRNGPASLYRVRDDASCPAGEEPAQAADPARNISDLI